MRRARPRAPPKARPLPPAGGDWELLGGFALVSFVLHTILYRGYGFFRDELYFIACSKHLAWGYVDQPPGVAVLAWLGRHLFGDNLFAVRFFPIVFVSLLIILVGLTARAMGGSRFAMALACLCTFAVPQYFGTWLNTDMFMTLGWAACAWIAARVFSGESPRLWIWFGVFAGLALQGKHAMVFFGLAFLLGLILTKQRRYLAGPWLWIGGFMAFLIALPNIIWESRHNWATYELLSNIAHSDKNVVLNPWRYLASNILSFTVLPSIIAFVGLGWLLFTDRGKPFRALGWTWVISYALMILLKRKDYYLTPVYSTLSICRRKRWNRSVDRWISQSALSKICQAIVVCVDFAWLHGWLALRDADDAGGKIYCLRGCVGNQAVLSRTHTTCHAAPAIRRSIRLAGNDRTSRESVRLDSRTRAQR